ncbi:quinon protein alcohol dehydrogenase-like superfamily [Cercophora newfieldiana]|uniref:Quinon protein alcohol dehydrogenase-like superfamily n=1 Tax=Cercophora newfieldiana TaxID=92897 RepID=A0AA39YGC8_9PEZI|nr:quinon protein alcohol dehydrogenase-like superfamily [Cercophora newfieldiana]
MAPLMQWRRPKFNDGGLPKTFWGTTFEVSNVIQPVYTGGSVGLDNGARILASTLGENAVLTELATGRQLVEIEGDGEPISTLSITPSASHLIVCSRSLTMRIYSLKVSPDFDSVEATLVRTSKPHATPVVVLAVDKTSTLLATGAADGAIKIWDVAGGYVTHAVSGPSVLISALHFFEIAATGRSGGSSATRKSGKKSRKDGDSEAQDNASGAQFWLAYGTQDGKIRVFDLNKRITLPVYSDAKRRKEAHESNVQSLAYSPELDALLSGSRDKTMTLWLQKDGLWSGTTMLRHESVEAVGFLHEGTVMYSAGTSGLLRLWDTTTHQELTAKQDAKSEAESILSAISLPHKSLILCAQADYTLAFYRIPSRATLKAQTPELLKPFRRISGTHDEILDLAYLLPDQSVMALATNSEDIRLVSVAETPAQAAAEDDAAYFGHDVALLKGHEDIVMSLDVDWSGHWVASGAKDNTARLWRVDPANNSYTCYAVFTGHIESVGAVALPKTVPQEDSDAYRNPLDHPPAFLISGSQDRFVQKRQIPRPSQKAEVSSGLRRLAHEKDINALDVSPSGKLFASASQDKTVKIWDVEKLEVQGILKGHKRGVWTVRFAPQNTPAIQGEQGSVSGKGVILTGSGDKTIKLWSLSDYTCIRTFEGHSHNVLKVVWLNVPSEDKASKKSVQFASAGADSLVKVWDANLGETDCTLDNHEDRLWTLAIHPKTNMLVSGGSDSKVTFWKDTTAETQVAATEAAFKLVEQEQELENYIHAGAYRDAIVLALQLNHPARLLNLFTNVVTTPTPEEGSISGIKAVDQVLATLSDEQLFLLLLRLRDWNTNARTAPVAQRVLSALVKSYPAAKFSNLSVKGAKGQKSLKEVLNGLKVYTERHYKRTEELVDESYLVEYTLHEMDSLAPPSSVQDVVMSEAR